MCICFSPDKTVADCLSYSVFIDTGSGSDEGSSDCIIGGNVKKKTIAVIIVGMCLCLFLFVCFYV